MRNITYCNFYLQVSELVITVITNGQNIYLLFKVTDKTYMNLIRLSSITNNKYYSFSCFFLRKQICLDFSKNYNFKNTHK